MVTRRDFIKTTAIASTAALSGNMLSTSCSKNPGRITIKSGVSRYEREPLDQTLWI